MKQIKSYLFLLAWVFFAPAISACADDKVPEIISLGISDIYDVEAYMNVDVNGHSFERNRQNGVGITMNYPAKSAEDPNMYIQIKWADVYRQEGYQTKTIKIDPSKLSRYTSNPNYKVSLDIELGRNGQVTITTHQQVFLDNLFTPKKITPEMRKPIILQQFCAEPWKPKGEELKAINDAIRQNKDYINETWRYAKIQPESKTICE